MGRVLVYTSAGCRHCVRAKQLLDSKGVEYEEVDLTAQPEKRNEMVTLSGGAKTVPQIFFNYDHIGGADNLDALEEEGMLDMKLEVCLASCPELTFAQRKVEVVKVDPETRLLCKLLEYVDLMLRGTKNIPPIKRKKRKFRSDSKSVTVAGVTDWLLMNASLSAQESSNALQHLIDRKFLILKDGSQKDSSRVRFSAMTNTNILNGERVFSGTSRPASAIANDLQVRMAQLSDSFISENGKSVDYGRCALSEEFRQYRIVAHELQTTDISSLSYDDALAFWLNLYNAIVVHANIAIGPPTNMLERSRFFSSIGYDIGGNIFTLSVIEHGILRCNRKPPASFFRTLKANDRRSQYIMTNFDPRIHFALVCGAKSCPPIRIYEANNVDDALQWATEGFVSEEVTFDPRKNVVTLSMLFKWYAGDFGRNKATRLRWIAGFMDDANAAELEKVVALYENKRNKVSIRMKYPTYDWDTNGRYGAEEDVQLMEQDTATLQSQLDVDSTPSVLETGISLIDGRGNHRDTKKSKFECMWDEINVVEKVREWDSGDIYRSTFRSTVVFVEHIKSVGFSMNLDVEDLEEVRLDDIEVINSGAPLEWHGETIFARAGILSSILHTNIVHYLGASYNAPNSYLVFQDDPLGLEPIETLLPTLTIQQKLGIAGDLLRAMCHLHSQWIAHNDFSIRCLWYKDGITKISGLENFIKVQDQNSTYECELDENSSPRPICRDTIASAQVIINLLFDLPSFMDAYCELPAVSHVSTELAEALLSAASGKAVINNGDTLVAGETQVRRPNCSDLLRLVEQSSA